MARNEQEDLFAPRLARALGFLKLRFWSPIAGGFLILLATVVPCVGQGTWLLNGASVIDPGLLPSGVSPYLETLGGRMTSAALEQISMTGTTTDANGSRPAQIIVQAPGYFSYREGLARAITFNGSSFLTLSGSQTTDDERVFESLLAHFPDAVFLQIAHGGGLKRIGSHFRNDNGTTKNYTGPFSTLYAFAPTTKPGLTQGKALQQTLYVALDDISGLLNEVRVVVNTGPGQTSVTQTQFSNWARQNGQWYPGQIVRLENGTQVLKFQTQQVSVGAGSPLTAFIP